MAVVWDPSFLAELHHDPANRRVVQVAYGWKKVVFDLKVEPAQVPRCNSAVGSKVRGGLDLMDRPFGWHLAGFRIGHRKSDTFRGVGELEDGREG